MYWCGLVVLSIVIENDRNSLLGMKAVGSTIGRYHMAFWPTDTEALLSIRPLLNAPQYMVSEDSPALLGALGGQKMLYALAAQAAGSS